jgi:hypothetical protein
MGKYSNLGKFLRDQKRSPIPMTFAEVEKIIGQTLPRSARYPAWWINNPSNNVMTKVWLEAGFKTEQVDTQAKKVVFRKADGDAAPKQPKIARDEGYYPFYGSMKGLIRIEPGVDLTEPADPDWGKVYE